MCLILNRAFDILIQFNKIENNSFETFNNDVHNEILK